MTLQSIKRAEMDSPATEDNGVATQFAALCYRVVKDKTEVLMITSRDRGRWVIPKGWPMDGKTPAECALIEAWEEAGVRGKVAGGCLGFFSYTKEIAPKDRRLCVAMVYPIKVKSLEDRFPEARERRRKWMRPKKAAARVEEPDLAELLRHFDPKALPA